jgi:DNA mismatch endonuclease (patch repair protein)
MHFRPLASKRFEVDIAFPRQKLAVFVDGCFWHGCPTHATRPRRNADWWSLKLDRNIERDREAAAILKSAGWTVLRYWEHEGAEAIAASVRMALTEAKSDPAATAVES